MTYKSIYLHLPNSPSATDLPDAMPAPTEAAFKALATDELIPLAVSTPSFTSPRLLFFRLSTAASVDKRTVTARTANIWRRFS